MRDFYFENKGTKIYCTGWEDVEAPLGTVVLVHDMGEYAKRYEDLAMFLNANGYYVVSMDLRAHGRTCGGYDHRGEVEGDCYADTVDDLNKLCCYALAQFKLPLGLVGMGYGALVAQGMMELYGDKLGCAALLGTTQADGLLSMGGLIVAGTEIGFVDSKNSGQVLSKVLMNMYERPYRNEKTRFSWLTRDKAAVKDYVADPYCGAQFAMSLAFEQSLFKWMLRINMRKKLLAIPADIPIWIASGDGDPVSRMGKNVLRLYNNLRQTSHDNIVLKMYEGARHALLWETNRDDVYMDLLQFLHTCLANI